MKKKQLWNWLTVLFALCTAVLTVLCTYFATHMEDGAKQQETSETAEEFFISTTVPTQPAEETTIEVTADVADVQVSGTYRDYCVKRDKYLAEHTDFFSKFLTNPVITSDALVILDNLCIQYDQLKKIYIDAKFFPQKSELSLAEYMVIDAEIGHEWLPRSVYEWEAYKKWNSENGSIYYEDGYLEFNPDFTASIVWSQNLDVLVAGDPGQYRSFVIRDPSQDAYVVLDGDARYMLRITAAP